MPAVARTATADADAGPHRGNTPPPVPTQQDRDRGFFNLPGLPPDLRGEVAQRLAPRSAAALILTSREMLASFGDAARAGRFCHEANGAGLQVLERLLTDQAGIATLPTALRAAPDSAVAGRLGELAQQLTEWPQQARTATFDKILLLLALVSSPATAGPLARLATAIASLPEPHRHTRFVALLSQGRSLPDADHLVLEVQRAEVIQKLPKPQRADAFRQLVHEAEDRTGEARGKVSQALRLQLPHLPAAVQVIAFRSLVDRSGRPDAQQGWEASHLVPYLAGLPMDARHEAFMALTRRLDMLPDDSQFRLLAALPLARRIKRLPSASHDEAARRIADVLRPLGGHHCNWVLTKSDADVPPAVKDALRQSTSKDTDGDPGRTGTRTHR